MLEISNIDYGPLSGLIGSWYGDKGVDMAPEEDGLDENLYYENITFTPVAEVENAERQTLVGLHYLQVVQRKSNHKVFHHETGYWLWDKATDTVMQSLVIPRAVGLLACGTYSQTDDGATILDVATDLNALQPNIMQSSFMLKNAKTTAFSHRIRIKASHMRYTETTRVDIYGEQFEHTDENSLLLKPANSA